MPLQRRGGIAIERRADGIRERAETYRLGVEDAVAIGKVMHRRSQSSRSVERNALVRPADDGKPLVAACAQQRSGFLRGGSHFGAGIGTVQRRRGRIERALAPAGRKPERGEQRRDNRNSMDLAGRTDGHETLPQTRGSYSRSAGKEAIVGYCKAVADRLSGSFPAVLTIFSPATRTFFGAVPP